MPFRIGNFSLILNTLSENRERKKKITVYSSYFLFYAKNGTFENRDSLKRRTTRPIVIIAGRTVETITTKKNFSTPANVLDTNKIYNIVATTNRHVNISF